ncbi:MAG: hypothetical protein RLZZ437_209 [Pseudomonadota bacterium]|jgi:hypothetical protein
MPEVLKSVANGVFQKDLVNEGKMGAVTVQQMAQRVNGLLEERLRARGNTLSDKLHHAGRRLPRRVRQAAGRLSVAEAKSAVPKLLLQVDEGAVARDYDTCVRHLTTINPAAGGALAGVVRVAASVAVGLLVLAVFAGGFVWLQGGV